MLRIIKIDYISEVKESGVRCETRPAFRLNNSKFKRA